MQASRQGSNLALYIEALLQLMHETLCVHTSKLGTQARTIWKNTLHEQTCTKHCVNLPLYKEALLHFMHETHTSKLGTFNCMHEALRATQASWEHASMHATLRKTMRKNTLHYQARHQPYYTLRHHEMPSTSCAKLCVFTQAGNKHVQTARTLMHELSAQEHSVRCKLSGKLQTQGTKARTNNLLTNTLHDTSL